MQPPAGTGLCQQITVHFYGSGFSQTPPLAIPIATSDPQIPLSCERVCMQSAEHLTKQLGRCYQRSREREIGPGYLPLFGLYAADHTQQHWLSDAHVFTESQDVYFRLKLRLAKGKIPDGIIMDYLYLQCADDFRSGRLWSHFEEKNKIEDIATLVAYIIWELASSGRYRMMVGRGDLPVGLWFMWWAVVRVVGFGSCGGLWFMRWAVVRVVTEDSKKLTTPLEQLTKITLIQRKITLWGLKHVIPKKLSEALRKEFNIMDPLMRYLMHNKLHEGMASFYENWKAETIENMRLQFVEDLMYKDVPYYGLEYYPAKKVDMNNETNARESDVEVIIRPYTDGCAPGLYFNKQMVCPLDAIVTVKITEQESNRKMQSCRVQLDRCNGPPVILDFPTRAAAESFATVLESYYRMQVNFFYSLTEGELAASTVKILQALRSFGPMREEDASERLKGACGPDNLMEKSASNERELTFLIYQDCVEFDTLHVLAGGGGEDSGKLTCDVRLQPNSDRELGVDFCITFHEGGTNETYTRSDDIRIDLSRRYGRQIVPRDERCRGMECVQEEEQLIPYNYYQPGHAPSRNADTDQLCLFEEAELAVTEKNRIAHGMFTDIYRTEHRKQGREVIIKKMTDMRGDVQQAYSRSMAHLHSLRFCSHIFVRFYGQMMLPPLRFVLESVPCGSLLHRLPQTPPLNWLQIGSVLVQLGHCLYDLKAKRTTYRSFCCKKILIHQENLEQLRIKLGDPCQTFYLDTLPVDDQQNTQRLPWVAVERFSNLALHTIESEVYAVGTTIWEMMTGKDPIREIPPLSVKNFFAEGNMLPDPCPSPTQEWVATQNFESAKPVSPDVSLQPVPAEGSSQRISGEESVSTYCKEHRTDGSASDSSNLTSGDTMMTSVSGSRSTSEGSCMSTKQQIVQQAVLLMRKCWNREPSERPTPNDFIKDAQKVAELADRAKEEDPEWQVRLCLEAIQKTDNITNQDAARQLQSRLAARQEVMFVDQSPENSDLLKKLFECSDRFIESSLLHLDDPQVSLGKGQFGVVLRGELSVACETRQAQRAQSSTTKVAVKQMSNPSSKNKQLFLKEALLWSKLHDPEPHSNIVLLHGIVLPGQSNMSSPFLLVMEFADLGSLESYVKKNKHKLGMQDFQKILCSMGKDVSEGMEFLSQRKLTHGDLAARNILLFTNPHRTGTPVAKVSDFGLAHWLKGGARGYYKRDNDLPFPAYWMALEVLEEDRYNSMTDVWSFGTVLWEMFSGDDPATAMNTAHLPEQEIVDALKRKYRAEERLPKPMYCPTQVYNLMRLCWHIDREERPRFCDLAQDIKRLIEMDLSN
ncbi:hypothetical protein BaRGS_00035190 [Batillaria attramentaria]|uniref:Protein kinase domain-containing protein n=1 Tax=Batillaria attramentaria TaxID=370345 RepID=A0ABD0JF95_9CAEN